MAAGSQRKILRDYSWTWEYSSVPDRDVLLIDVCEDCIAGLNVLSCCIIRVGYDYSA